MEHGGSFFEVADLGFGRCRFALAVKKGTDFYSGYSEKTVATKYPNVARNYFADKSMDVRVIKIEGSVELAPAAGTVRRDCRYCRDRYDTAGKTDWKFRKMSRQFRRGLIVNPASLKMRKKELEPLINAIQQATRELRLK